MRHPASSESLPLFPIIEDTASGFTARDLLRMAFKYSLTVGTCLVLVSLASWGLIYLLPPLYESSAKVWVQAEQQGTLTFLSSIEAHREIQAADPVNRKIETEMQILLSRSSVEAVVARLGITKDQLVQPPVDFLRARLPRWMHLADKASPAQIRNETVDLFIKGIAVEALRSKTADTTSSVLEVRFACADKGLAAPALAALVDEYIQYGLKHRRDFAETTYRLVQSRIDENDSTVKKLDGQILALTVEQASRADVSSRSNVVVTKGAARGDSALESTLSSGRTGAPSSLSLLKSETVEMQAKLEEARQLFTDDSPNVRHLREQLQALRDRLNDGVRSSTGLDTELEQLERQRTIALARFSELRAQRDQLEVFVQLNQLQNDSRLMTENPLPPDKANVKIKITLGVLAPIVGMLLGLILAGLREYFDHRLQSDEDVRRYLGLDTLAILPFVKSS